MTKKQQAALKRIIDREASRIEWEKQNKKVDIGIERKAGVHPSGERHIVTDGMVAVIFQEKPDGVPEAERMDELWNFMRREVECSDKYTDHFLALTVTADHISEWKKLSKDWKSGKTYKTGAVPVKLIAQNNDGGMVDRHYDPRHLVDTVEAIGPGAMIYIGKYSRQSCFCSLLVYPKNWMEDANHSIGYVLPLRIS